jgi:Ala-tRNA(Pro) deacylase
VNAEDRLRADLDALGIGWRIDEHEAVFTVEESRELHKNIAGAHTKNLFLKDAGGAYWLVTVPADARVDLKALPALIGSKRLSFGKGDDMIRLLGVSPGSATPFGAINDTERLVTIVLDRGLAEADTVNVHPLRNTATIGLSGAELVRALVHWEHPPVIVSVPAMEPAQ